MAIANPSAKQQMLEILDGLPDDSSYDELLRELAFDQMIEEGIEDEEQGRTISHEEMMRRASSWAK